MAKQSRTIREPFSLTAESKSDFLRRRVSPCVPLLPLKSSASQRPETEPWRVCLLGVFAVEGGSVTHCIRLCTPIVLAVEVKSLEEEDSGFCRLAFCVARAAARKEFLKMDEAGMD